VISYDLLTDRPGGALHRIAYDQEGRAFDDLIELDHGCLGCTLKRDLLEALRVVADLERWQAVVLALPLATSPEPIAVAIDAELRAGRLSGLRLAPVISVLEAESVVTDIVGDDLLDERGLAHGAQDRRSVGEVACAQLEYADAIMTIGDRDARTETLLRHLIAPSSALLPSPHQVQVAELIARSHDCDRARIRTDPLALQPRPVADADGVWTVALRSVHPFHPHRLMEQLEEIGVGAVRARGHFWLPTRPDSICVWDGAGGQLSIGENGSWADRRRHTSLVITGIDEQDRRRISRAFNAIVMTPREARDLDRWRQVDDGFAPWLGAATSAA
jgi:G3E family GTPase